MLGPFYYLIITHHLIQYWDSLQLSRTEEPQMDSLVSPAIQFEDLTFSSWALQSVWAQPSKTHLHQIWDLARNQPIHSTYFQPGKYEQYQVKYEQYQVLARKTQFTGHPGLLSTPEQPFLKGICLWNSMIGQLMAQMTRSTCDQAQEWGTLRVLDLVMP